MLHDDVDGQAGRSVVVGVGDSLRSGRTLALAALVAGAHGLPLVVVHVERAPTAVHAAAPTSAAGSLVAANATTTDSVHMDCEVALASHPGAWTFEVRQGEAAGQLTAAARHHRAGVIVVGVRRRRFGRSLAERLIRSSGLPVVVVPSAR